MRHGSERDIWVPYGMKRISPRQCCSLVGEHRERPRKFRYFLDSGHWSQLQRNNICDVASASLLTIHYGNEGQGEEIRHPIKLNSMHTKLTPKKIPDKTTPLPASIQPQQDHPVSN